MKSRRCMLLVLMMTLLVSIGANAKVYLVAVGISDYPGKVNDLKLPTADAKALVQLYRANKNLGAYTLLLDRQATAANIVAAMERTYSQAGPEDIVVFTYSGHGSPIGFNTYDLTLTYDRVRKEMSKSRSKHKMIFADSCHAGKMRVKKSSTKVNTGDSDVMFFLSSRDNEMSIENKFLKNGLFTTALLSGLKGNADANRDRVITAKELFQYVSKEVQRTSKGQQHPVMWGNFRDDMPVMKW